MLTLIIAYASAVRNLALRLAVRLFRLLAPMLLYIARRSGGPSIGWAIAPALRIGAMLLGLPAAASLLWR